ncbi:MAG: glycosyltransferase family 4 protein [Sedimentisphaerales bacterium]|nr:glycosyltransferase family 4 protein [Sedimentisphaerales bacterium]
MRVVLDFQSVLRDRHSGFFTYAAGLLAGWAALTERPELVLFCGRRAAGHGEWLSGRDREAGATWRTTRLKMRHLGIWWRRIGWPPLQHFTGEFDLYHCNHHLMAPTRGRPRLLTVHDLRRYRFGRFYPQSKRGPFECAVRRADHFIAISRATKRDLQEFFSIPAEKIDVVYHGGPWQEFRQDRDDGAEVLARYGLRRCGYFVVFSSYDRRKNIPNTIRAFAEAADRLADDFRLVIVGSKPAGPGLVPDDLPARLAERLVWTGPLERLQGVLGNAAALVYVSLYEGFGLPILEAMAAGTAVITSNCSAMPEVAGDAALLVDPQDVSAIGRAMVTLVENPARRAQLIAAGAERCREFSWTRAARQTQQVYEKLIG